jgi:hypothetical protein
MRSLFGGDGVFPALPPQCVPDRHIVKMADVIFAFETPYLLLTSITVPVLIQIDPTQSRLAEHSVADLGLVGLEIVIDHDPINDEISVSILNVDALVIVSHFATHGLCPLGLPDVLACVGRGNRRRLAHWVKSYKTMSMTTAKDS